MRIEFQENKQKNGKPPQRGSAVAEEGKRNANDGEESDRHADVYREVKK